MEDIKVYTVEEVSELLKVAKRTIRDYIKVGKIKAHKIGRAYRIKHEDLQEFLDNTTV